MDKVIYRELSYQIVGCFYDVYNELGPLHKEQIYHESLKISFDSKDIKYANQPRLKVEFRNKEVGIYVPDFIVEDKILVEIKSVLTMPKVFEKQLYYYLRGSKYKVGYLVNFGSDRLDIRRRVYESTRNHSRKFALDSRQFALSKR